MSENLRIPKHEGLVVFHYKGGLAYTEGGDLAMIAILDCLRRADGTETMVQLVFPVGLVKDLARDILEQTSGKKG